MTVQTTFRGFTPTQALETLVHEQAEHLERFAPRIVSCRIAVERPQSRRGGPVHVRIDIRLPGETIVVGRRPSLHARIAAGGGEAETKSTEIEAPFKDAMFAVTQAFAVAGRRLQDRMRRRQGAVKRHERAPHATVSRIDRSSDFGFLTTDDGEELYFHRNSVIGGGFDQLRVGGRVTYVLEEGEKGAQASTVRPAEGATTRRRIAHGHQEVRHAKPHR